MNRADYHALRTIISRRATIGQLDVPTSWLLQLATYRRHLARDHKDDAAQGLCGAMQAAFKALPWDVQRHTPNRDRWQAARLRIMNALRADCGRTVFYVHEWLIAQGHATEEQLIKRVERPGRAQQRPTAALQAYRRAWAAALAAEYASRGD